MCINPARTPDGLEFGCRKCWQCIENATQDWVGRCIAQSKTSTHTRAVTLTYGGGDHERAAVLTYSDVQKYFKRLRKAGYKFKYLIAGEYGTLKGRAHWHGILFFDGEAPPHPIRQNFQDPFWGHGHSFWDHPSPKAVRYVCKYIRKDDEDSEVQGHFAMSKKPPIGAEYFTRLAQKHVDAGLPPRDLRYSFPENLDKDGKPIRHYMHGATARDFLQAFVDKWQQQRGNEEWPRSELVDDFCDKLAGYAPEPQLRKFYKAPFPDWVPFRGCEKYDSEPHNTFYVVHEGTTYWWRPLKDEEREWAWQSLDGQVVRYEQSDQYRDLTRSAQQRKEQRERQAPPLITTRSVGEIRSQDRQSSKATAKRLPMVGDGW